MSHNVTIKGVKITDVHALKSAVRELNQKNPTLKLKVTETGKFRTWPGQDDTCAFAVEIPGSSHDLGFVKQTDGSFAPVFDPFGGGVGRAIGADWAHVPSCSMHSPEAAIGRLMQLYAVHAVERQALNQGLSTSRQLDDKTGQIAVVVNY